MSARSQLSTHLTVDGQTISISVMQLPHRVNNTTCRLMLDVGCPNEELHRAVIEQIQMHDGFVAFERAPRYSVNSRTVIIMVRVDPRKVPTVKIAQARQIGIGMIEQIKNHMVYVYNASEQTIAVDAHRTPPAVVRRPHMGQYSH